MAPPKLPPDQRTRNGCVSLLESEWAGIDAFRLAREQLLKQMPQAVDAPVRRVSRSSIVREAVREYLARRFGPTPVAAEPVEPVAVSA